MSNFISSWSAPLDPNVKIMGFTPRVSAKKSAESDKNSDKPDRFTSNSCNEKEDGILSRCLKMKQEIMEGAHIAGIIAEKAEAVGVVAGAATLGTLASGIFFAHEGIKELPKALKEKNGSEILSSVSSLGLAGDSFVETASAAAGTASIAKIMGPLAPAILGSTALATLGPALMAVHGGAEGILSAKEMYEGVKSGDKSQAIAGALGVGASAAVITLAAGGGFPVAAALGTLFVAKMVAERPEKVKEFTNNLVNKFRSEE